MNDSENDIDDFLLNKMNSEVSNSSHENDNLAEYNQIYVPNKLSKTKSKSFDSHESISENNDRNNTVLNLDVNPHSEILKSSKFVTDKYDEKSNKNILSTPSNINVNNYSTESDQTEIFIHKITDSIINSVNKIIPDY